MTIPKLDAATELIISRTFVDELDDYLKSDVLYWPITRATPLGDKLPQLTIGGLLESIGRAEAAANDLTPDQATELSAIRQQHDRLRDARPAAYTSKAAREFASRLDAWSQYLDDATRKPADVAAYYPHEVRTRAKAHLLAQGLGRDLPAATRARQSRLDARLLPMLQPGAFVWDARLQAAFPHDTCWWLYGHLID
ncbi:MAG TPA: hypothetical protein VFF59_12230 [Anaerolineae bacterium]|jgi:hypothetical protein|nr:hypothetical protein [Anaerolineae bacterium]